MRTLRVVDVGSPSYLKKKTTILLYLPNQGVVLVAMPDLLVQPGPCMLLLFSFIHCYVC